MKEEKSECCKAIKEAIYSDEGTGHYVCLKCKSEFIPESSEEKEEEITEKSKIAKDMIKIITDGSNSDEKIQKIIKYFNIISG